MFKINYLKLCRAFSLPLLLTTAISSSTVAHDDNLDLFPTGEHEGGGTRGKAVGCALKADNPTSLIPQNTRVLTVSDSPELFFYVPDVVEASALELVLLDEDDLIVYRDEFNPGYKPGIVSIDLVDRSNSDTLEVDRLYHWYLVKDCDEMPTPKIVANGSLQRIKLERVLASRLENASTIEQVKLYQEADIWHEAIANLARLQCDLTAEKFISQAKIDNEKIEDYARLLVQSEENYCDNNSNL